MLGSTCCKPGVFSLRVKEKWIRKDFLFSEKRSSYSSLSALNLVCNHYFNVKCSLVFARACIHTLVDHFGLGYLPERLRTWATLKTLIKEIKDFKKFQEESGIVPSTNSNTDGYQSILFQSEFLPGKLI